MKNKYNIKILTGMCILILVVTACGPASINTAEPVSPSDDLIGLANPSAVYCEGLGYTTESVERNGGMDSDCIFPDGSRCPAWDFLAGRCGQQYTFCSSQGNSIESTGSSIGTCRFTDGSSCGEFEYFSGDCKPALKPDAETNDATQTTGQVEIQGFQQALEFLVSYLKSEYALDLPGPWTEQNISSQSSPENTFRYVAGPFTIVLSAEVAAPWPNSYTIREATSLASGFSLEGMLSYDGVITETRVVLPAVILDEIQAREAVLNYLELTYNVSIEGEWQDEGVSQSGGTNLIRSYSSGDWKMTLEFTPAAPHINSYLVTLESDPGTTRWQGHISSSGEITETSFTR